MRTFLKIIKWIFGIGMGFCLVLGLINFFGMGLVSDMLPTSVDDLGWAPVTVKQIDTVPSGVVFRTPDLPTVFVINLIPPPADINQRVKPGDKIALRIKKELLGHLTDAKVVSVYGVQLADGSNMYDNTAMITPVSDADRAMVHNFAKKMIAISAIYFLAVLFVPMAWRRYKRST